MAPFWLFLALYGDWEIINDLEDLATHSNVLGCARNVFSFLFLVCYVAFSRMGLKPEIV